MPHRKAGALERGREFRELHSAERGPFWQDSEAAAENPGVGGRLGWRATCHPHFPALKRQWHWSHPVAGAAGGGTVLVQSLSAQ